LKRFAYYLALILGSLRTIQAQPPAVTVCQVLSNPQRYDGRIIALRGTYRSAVDVGGLAGAGCDGILVTAGYTWPSFVWLASPASRGVLHKADFPPNPSAFEKLAALLRQAGFDNHLYSAKLTATVTFVGLFETYGDLAQRVRSTSYGPRGFGFGNDDGAPAQLLVKTISLDDVVIEPKPEAPRPR
jgi:hypothetical protein